MPDRGGNRASVDATISVIIPCYNRAALVGDTLCNLLAQSLPPDQIIVVDDGSTDGSADVIRSFGDKVLLIEQTNQGPGAARNAGLAAATGRYLQFFDSDDLASRNKLAVQVAALENSEADFAYGPWVRTRIAGADLTFEGPVMQGGPLPDWKPMLEWQMGSWCLVFQNCLFRREAIERAGKFRTDLMPTEDSEFLVRILLAGARPVFTGECLVFYRVHESHQITGSGTSAQRRSDDWSHYFDVVGAAVAERLFRMHPSTRREIALSVYRHLRNCRLRNWREPLATGPFRRLEASFSRWQLLAADLVDRCARRLRRLPEPTPSSRGLALQAPGQRERALAEQSGYHVAATTR